MPSKTPIERQVGIRVTANVPGLDQIREKFKELPKNFSARYMAAGLRDAIEQGNTLNVLKNLTPKGPTGNLRRSIGIKTRAYVSTGVGYAIIGYKSGRKLNEPFDPTKQGYHQGLVEFGTKQRYRRTKDGRTVSTGKMPVGGSYARPPVRTAWEMTRTAVEARMVDALTKAFENAGKDLAYRVKGLQGPF